MLFNSYIFIFAFLPIVLLVFFAIGSGSHHRAAIAWLVIASLFFYGWWNPVYVSLMILSILVNYGLGVSISSDRRNKQHQKLLLILGVTANLGLLGYYKYANFFVNNYNDLADASVNLAPIILPLAISFFTFQQVAYLVDTYQNKTKEYNFLHYCLFCDFFSTAYCRSYRP